MTKLICTNVDDGVVKLFKSYLPSENCGIFRKYDRKALIAAAPEILTAIRVLPQKPNTFNAMPPWFQSASSMSSILSASNPRTSRFSRYHLNQAVNKPTVATKTIHNTTIPGKQSSRSRLHTMATFRKTGSSERNANGCEIVVNWSQSSGLIYASGRENLIQIWDINNEQCVREFIPRIIKGVSCMSIDQNNEHILVAGSYSGMLRVFDFRKPSRSSCVQTWREDELSSVVGCHIRSGVNRVLSASRNGVIKTWDLRQGKSVLTLDRVHTGHSISHFTAHPQIPVMASGSEQSLKIWNVRGKCVGDIDSSLAYTSNISIITSFNNLSYIAFHPYLPIVSMANSDGLITNISPQR